MSTKLEKIETICSTLILQQIGFTKSDVVTIMNNTYSEIVSSSYLSSVLLKLGYKYDIVARYWTKPERLKKKNIETQLDKGERIIKDQTTISLIKQIVDRIGNILHYLINVDYCNGCKKLSFCSNIPGNKIRIFKPCKAYKGLVEDITKIANICSEIDSELETN